MARSIALAFLIGLVPTASGQLRQVIRQFPAEVKCVSFSPDGKTLATGVGRREGLTDAVSLWEVATGKEICRLGDNYPLGCGALTFSADGKTLVTNGGGPELRVLLWDLATRKVRLSIRGPRGFGACIAVSPDSKTLATGGGGPPVQLFDMETGKERTTPEGGFKANAALAFSRDGKQLAGSTHEGKVGLWDVATGKKLAILEKHNRAVNLLAFSPDGKTLYTMSEDQLLVYWDTASGKIFRVSDNSNGPSREHGAISPDGRTVAILGVSIVRLFDLERAGYWPGIEWMERDGDRVCVAFSPDGRQIATGGGGKPTQNSVYLYDVPSRKASPPD